MISWAEKRTDQPGHRPPLPLVHTPSTPSALRRTMFQICQNSFYLNVPIPVRLISMGKSDLDFDLYSRD